MMQTLDTVSSNPQPTERRLELPEPGVIGRWLDALERQFGITGSGLVIALLIIAVGKFYAYPIDPGDQFYILELLQKARHPLSQNDMSSRILTPLLVYLSGLDRLGFILINNLISGLLLGLIYRDLRTTSYRPALALAATLIVGFSITTLLTVWWQYFIDPLTYLLVFLGFRFAARPLLAWAVMLLAVTNHENAIFFFPILAFFQLALTPAGGPGFRITAAGLSAICLILVVLFLRYLSQINPNSSRILSGFLSDPAMQLRQTEEHFFVGIFAAYKLAWLLPPAAAVIAFQRGWYRELAGLAALLAPPLALLIIATGDLTRYLGWAFLAMLWSIELLRRHYREESLASVLLLLTGLNLLIPQFVVFGPNCYFMQSALHRLIAVIAQARH